MAGLNTAMSGLFKFSMGLYGDHASRTDTVFNLAPVAICTNLLAMIRSRHPRLGRFIIVVAPFIMLGYAGASCLGKSGFIPGLPARICRAFMATITVPDNHPLLNEVKKWMVAQAMKASAQETTLKQESPTRLYYGRRLRDGDDEEKKKRQSGICLSVSLTEEFTTIASMDEETTSDGKAVRVRSAFDGLQVSISCFSIGAGPGPVLAFLKHIESLHVAGQEFRTKIHQASFEDKDGWTFSIVDRPSRPLESVTLPDSQKLPLMKDIESYLSKEIELFYASRGIPLRRRYLLYGPPGTGKTSFYAAIAGNLRLDLFIVNLNTPGLDDNDLRTLFECFPDRCVVLLEDIDSAGIQRENMRDILDCLDDKKKSTATVTLSGLLNVLDGPASAEGRLVIMTSNAPESLDPALVRPGRIDMKVHLGNACTEVLAKMLTHIFAHIVEDHDSAKSDTRNKHIAQLANSFASLVPPEMLTPAEVQSFQMMHRSDPEKAVAKAEQWAADLIEAKASGKNVSSPSIIVTPADVDHGAEEDEQDEPRNDEPLGPWRLLRSKRSDARSKKVRTKSRKHDRGATSVERGY